MASFCVAVLLEPEPALSPSAAEALALRLLAPYQRLERREPENTARVLGQEFDFCYVYDDANDLEQLGIAREAAEVDDPANWQVCPACWGSGRRESSGRESTCDLCAGSGTVRKAWRLAPGILSVSLFNPRFVPAAVVTPDGVWHQGDEVVSSLLKQHQEHIAALVHCHG